MAEAKKHSEGYTTTYIPEGFKFPSVDDINRRIKDKPVITDKIVK